MISHLFKNGIIVTVNPDREIFFHGAVAVKDDRIVEVGPTEQWRPSIRIVNA